MLRLYSQDNSRKRKTPSKIGRLIPKEQKWEEWQQQKFSSAAWGVYLPLGQIVW